MEYFGNAFSLQMLNLGASTTVTIEPMSKEDKNTLLSTVKAENSKIKSIIGHEDLATLLDVPFNRETINIVKGDILYVAQVIGGRLPKGTTELPKGISIVFVKVTIQ